MFKQAYFERFVLNISASPRRGRTFKSGDMFFRWTHVSGACFAGKKPSQYLDLPTLFARNMPFGWF